MGESSEPGRLINAIPVLPSSGLEASLDYYRTKLGFEGEIHGITSSCGGMRVQLTSRCLMMTMIPPRRRCAELACRRSTSCMPSSVELTSS